MEVETLFEKLDNQDLTVEEERYFNAVQISYTLGKITDSEAVYDLGEVFADKLFFANTAIVDMDTVNV